MDCAEGDGHFGMGVEGAEFWGWVWSVEEHGTGVVLLLVVVVDFSWRLR